MNYCLSYFEGGGLELEEDYARDVHGGGVIGSHNGKLGLRCTFLMRDLLILIFGVIEDEKNKDRIFKDTMGCFGEIQLQKYVK